MKRRASIDKAKLTQSREGWYKEECEKILFRAKSEILVEDERVYLIVKEKKEQLLEITSPKTKWFEIWLKLKNSN